MIFCVWILKIIKQNKKIRSNNSRFIRKSSQKRYQPAYLQPHWFQHQCQLLVSFQHHLHHRQSLMWFFQFLVWLTLLPSVKTTKQMKKQHGYTQIHKDISLIWQLKWKNEKNLESSNSNKKSTYQCLLLGRDTAAYDWCTVNS